MKITPQQHVLHILCRITEPCFIPKGQMRLAFDVLHNDFLAPEFREVRRELKERFLKDHHILVSLKEIKFPDLSEPMELERDGTFSIFIPYHRKMFEKLLRTFMCAPKYEDFLSTTVYARDRVNPVMFAFAFCAAVIHRSDTKGLQLPPLNDVFPDKFVDGRVISEAREYASLLTMEQNTVHIKKSQFFPVPKNYTSSDLDPENRVAYFREDIGVNLHHCHWHLIYPFCDTEDMVKKERRGELFYYMHRQIVARYDSERLCNHLGRVTRLIDLRKPISEGYFPKLYCSIAKKMWPSRSSESTLSDVSREDLHMVFDIDDLERWKNRIIEAIHLKRVIDKEGRSVPLTGTDGIDILGNMVESSKMLSVNYSYYGDLHNFGHVAISVCHDPDRRYEESVGIIGDTTTAMRDPAFYRWHSYIDYIFELHKNTLPPYLPAELDYEGVEIEEISVHTHDESCVNVLKTFWEERDVGLTCGLDFTDHMAVYARVTRLQHRSFSYKIQVKNHTNGIINGMVRIFLAPKLDEKGNSLQLIDQKRLFIELDKFQVPLFNNSDINIIERGSKDSNVTNDMEMSFEKIEESLMENSTVESTSYANFCGYGWPQNMLIPKGSAEGFECQLFVMISNAVKDVVDAHVDGACKGASSYCGARDKEYPDLRPMGFPFDRMTTDKTDTLEDFANRSPNMAVKDVTIIFEGRKKPMCDELWSPSAK